MKQHSHNAMYLAERFERDGLKVSYPGLPSHRDHELMKSMMHEGYGFGGLMTLDVETTERANALMELMQSENLGYLAVSLGFYKTLFSCSGSSTSSEIPEQERLKMGISDGLIRFSIGLDQDIERTYHKMRKCMQKTGVLK